MPVKTLIMIFQNQTGDAIRLSADNVRDDITDAEVKAAMEAVIAKNIFTSDGGDFVSIEGAQIVTRSVQELTVR